MILDQDTPEQREAYLRDRPEGWPDSFQEAMAIHAPDWPEQATMEILRRLIDEGERGEKINGMVWTTGEMNAGLEFFISDAPLQHTTPIIAPGGYIVMPIGPKRLFVATNEGDDETLAMFQSIDANSLVEQINKVVVGRASEFVGATSLDQLAFVETHFATEAHNTILKGIARRYREGDA